MTQDTPRITFLVHHRLARHQIRVDELLDHIGSDRITSTDMCLLPAHTNTHVGNIIGRIALFPGLNTVPSWMPTTTPFEHTCFTSTSTLANTPDL